MAAASLVASCSGDGPVTPPTQVLCDGVTQDVLTLAQYEGAVLVGNAAHCAVLAGGGTTYLVIPQLTGETLPYGGFGFRIGDPDAPPTLSLMDDLRAATRGDAPANAQQLLDATMRERERSQRGDRRPRSALHAYSGANALLAADTLRRFSVLATLDATPAWTPVDARLRFEGDRVLLYVDTLASSAFDDAELRAMGTLYDDILAPRMFDAFGPGSDVDANGRVLFVLSPVVNAMVTAQQCPTIGFVRGFFYSHDLASASATSNQGEVFYAYVPDAAGQWSCAHTKAEVMANLPPTFIHELQHMISFGAHAIVRGGGGEEPWLNEGLSHFAEELGSLYWESLFPPPLGRTNASQIFPDSSAAYINPNLLYSYRFLSNSFAYSLTVCAPGSFCSQTERGGVWLFLRWIADQKGSSILSELVQTSLTGRANLEAATGEATAELLGDFAIAANADSIENVDRARIPSRYRFATRNFRAIYQKLFEAYGISGGVARPFPIMPLALTRGESRTGTMRPSTLTTYRLVIGAQEPAARLRFAAPDGSAFPASSGAQVSVFRIQ